MFSYGKNVYTAGRLLSSIPLIAFVLVCQVSLSLTELHAQTSFRDSDLYVINTGGKCGYIDKTGKIIIQPSFDGARDFSEGLAIIWSKEKDRRSGYIDVTGKLVIEPQFANAESFHDGLALVSFEMAKWPANPKNVFINKSGAVVIQPKTEGMSFSNSFSEGLATFRLEQGDKKATGYINTKGEIVIEAKYEGAMPFSEGLAAVLISRKWGFIDKRGKIIIPPQYDFIQSFSEGLAPVEVASKWGYIDQKGNMVIKPAYGFMEGFSDGLASFVVIEGEKPFSGYLDKNGAIKIAPRFKNASKFSEGLAAVNTDETEEYWGYIDKDGKWAIAPQWKGEGRPGEFRGGLALIDLRDGKVRYIDKVGNIVWKNY
jgi:hypothetical protein